MNRKSRKKIPRTLLTEDEIDEIAVDVQESLIEDDTEASEVEEEDAIDTEESSIEGVDEIAESAMVDFGESQVEGEVAVADSTAETIPEGEVTFDAEALSDEEEAIVEEIDSDGDAESPKRDLDLTEETTILDAEDHSETEAVSYDQDVFEDEESEADMSNMEETFEVDDYVAEERMSQTRPLEAESLNFFYRFLLKHGLEPWLMTIIVIAEWCRLYLSPIAEIPGLILGIREPESVLRFDKLPSSLKRFRGGGMSDTELVDGSEEGMQELSCTLRPRFHCTQ
jgi:hypothetical protein